LPSANRERSFDFAWVHVLQDLSRQKNLNIELYIAARYGLYQRDEKSQRALETLECVVEYGVPARN
jgi:hypothetical protein